MCPPACSTTSSTGLVLFSSASTIIAVVPGRRSDVTDLTKSESSAANTASLLTPEVAPNAAPNAAPGAPPISPMRAPTAVPTAVPNKGLSLLSNNDTFPLSSFLTMTPALGLKSMAFSSLSFFNALAATIPPTYARSRQQRNAIRATWLDIDNHVVVVDRNLE